MKQKVANIYAMAVCPFFSTLWKSKSIPPRKVWESKSIPPHKVNICCIYWE